EHGERGHHGEDQKRQPPCGGARRERRSEAPGDEDGLRAEAVSDLFAQLQGERHALPGGGGLIRARTDREGDEAQREHLAAQPFLREATQRGTVERVGLGTELAAAGVIEQVPEASAAVVEEGLIGVALAAADLLLQERLEGRDAGGGQGQVLAPQIPPRVALDEPRLRQGDEDEQSLAAQGAEGEAHRITLRARAEVVAAPLGGERASNAEPAVTPEREQVGAGPCRVERSGRAGLELDSALRDALSASVSDGGPSDAAEGGDAGEEQATGEHVARP